MWVNPSQKKWQLTMLCTLCAPFNYCLFEWTPLRRRDSWPCFALIVLLLITVCLSEHLSEVTVDHALHSLCSSQLDATEDIPPEVHFRKAVKYPRALSIPKRIIYVLYTNNKIVRTQYGPNKIKPNFLYVKRRSLQ